MSNANKQKKSRYKKVIIWTAVVLLAAVLIVPGLMNRKQTLYKEIIPETGAIITYYSFTGSVEAVNKQTVYADKAMQISEIYFKEGDSVKKDDILFKTTIGEEIKAPLDGELSTLTVEVNAQLLPGGVLAMIADYSELQVSVQVDEYDLAAVTEGKAATVHINALDKDIEGTVDKVSKEGVYANGITYFTAVFRLENDGTVKAGMSTEAKILKDDVKDALIIPLSAVSFDDDNTPYVLIKNEKGNPVRRDFTAGVNNGTYVQVLEGITKDDVLLVPDEGLSSGFGFRNNS